VPLALLGPLPGTVDCEPLVGANVCAGLANNIFGTRSALDGGIACGPKRFTLISTDKAVRPTNVMGGEQAGE